MKKIVAEILAVTLMCTVLAGCGSSDAATGEAVNGDPGAALAVDSTELGVEQPADDGVVTLTVWAEPTEYDTLNKMIESFKTKYAGQAEFDIQLAENADAETKNNVLADVHNAADVFPLPDDQIASMVAAGALAPVPNADEVSAANLEDAVAAATIGDVLYAYPMTADNGYFLYYNKNYLTEEDVATLDGILAVAAEDGKKFSMDWTSGWYLYSFFGNTGMDFGVNEDGVTNHCDWNRADGAVKGVDVASAMLAISSSPAFANMTDEGFMAGVADDSVIAGVSGVWNATGIKAVWGDNYGAVKLPTYTCAGQQVQMASFKGYKMMGVNAYSDHVDWALKLADWFTNEENQTLRLAERDQGPSNSNAAASEAVQNVPAIQAVIAQSEYGKLQRVGNSYWDPCTAYGISMAAGNPSGTELQEVMDILVAGITASSAN